MGWEDFFTRDWELRRGANKLTTLVERGKRFGRGDLRNKEFVDLEHASLEALVDLVSSFLNLRLVLVVLLHGLLD